MFDGPSHWPSDISLCPTASWVPSEIKSFNRPRPSAHRFILTRAYAAKPPPPPGAAAQAQPVPDDLPSRPDAQSEHDATEATPTKPDATGAAPMPPEPPRRSPRPPEPLPPSPTPQAPAPTLPELASLVHRPAK
jgi:hypothetical protein